MVGEERVIQMGFSHAGGHPIYSITCRDVSTKEGLLKNQVEKHNCFGNYKVNVTHSLFL